MPSGEKTFKNGFLPLERRRKKMNVRFQGSDTTCQMKVTVPAEGLVQLHFPIPDGVEVTTGFEVLTEKGTVYGDYTGYTTIYREMEDGRCV